MNRVIFRNLKLGEHGRMLGVVNMRRAQIDNKKQKKQKTKKRGGGSLQHVNSNM